MQADIMEITNRWWYGLRVDDPSTLLCGRFYILILVIILIDVIATW